MTKDDCPNCGHIPMWNDGSLDVSQLWELFDNLHRLDERLQEGAFLECCRHHPGMATLAARFAFDMMQQLMEKEGEKWRAPSAAEIKNANELPL